MLFWIGCYFFVLFEEQEELLKIAKVLNNNIVVAVNDQGEDVIVMGSGVAFGKKRGDDVEPARIERLFTKSVSEMGSRFEQLAKEIPPEYIDAADKIIANAKLSLGKELEDDLYLSLADHIYFTIQRCKSGMLIHNRLLLETRMLYREEFETGCDAICYLNQRFGVNLPEDEAAFIALHFVNATLGMRMNETMEITSVVQEISSIIRHTFRLEFDVESLDYYRLITHLKFFAQRMVTQTHLASEGEDFQLYEMVKTHYAASYDCVQKIVSFLENRHRWAVSFSEQTYLTIHVERIRRSSEENKSSPKF